MPQGAIHGTEKGMGKCSGFPGIQCDIFIKF
jgi:hypothetical protein